MKGNFLIALINNIFIRKKAGKPGKESAEQVQTIFNAAPDSVIVIDEQGKIVQWNPKSTTVFGWSAEEVMNKPLSEVIIPYRYREAHQKGMKRFLETGEGPVLGKTIEIQALHRDNTEFDVALSISPTTVNGKHLFIGFLHDITEKKKAEEKIRENQRVFSTLFYQSPVMKAIAAANTGKYIEVNDAFAGFMGYTKEEILGKTSFELNMLVHPGEWDRILETLAKDGFVRDIETEINGNGKTRWVSTNIDKMHLYGQDCYLTAAIDITARKEAEESIRQMNMELEKRVEEKTREIIQNEKRFRNLIDNSTDIISLTDENFNPVYRSPSTERITGWTNEEREKFSGLELTHPEDLAGMQHTIKKIQETPGKPFHVTFRSRHKDGHYVWMEGTMTNMLQDESIKAIVGNVRDITQKKEAEEKLIKSEKIYKTIASSIPGSVICLLDTDYRYLLIEGDMVEKLGYSKFALLGNKMEEVLATDIFEGIQKELQKVVAGETVTRESRSFGNDILSRFIPLKDENNIVYAVMTVTLDVTNLKNAQRDIAGLNRDLEEKITTRTEQLMEAFSYSVSHDLRAPLRAIIGFAGILEEDYGNKLDDEARRIITVIRNNTGKMGNLIDDLLSFAQTGRRDMVKMNINTRELVQEIITELDIEHTSHAITWEIQVLPDVYGDMATMRQVWINIISNAIKYTGGKPKPHIEIGSFEQQQQTVFFIKDNGVGFDSKYSNKLFKVFQRLHSAVEFEGTGVGLAIVEKIISRHGGKIWAEAELDKGATFYFSLPGA